MHESLFEFPTLSPAHEAELFTGSSIDPDIARDRGYRTITDPDDLPEAFVASQRRPGLLIPIHTVRGAIESWQLKPDTPRIIKGKAVKYETAANAPQVLDVPRSALHWLSDPAKPVVITEGAKKVDAGTTHDIGFMLGLQGVYGWRGKNSSGGKTALADWESIAMNGRDAIIAFDSDVMSKHGVRDALDRFSRFLTSRQSIVHYLLMPHLPNGEKCGLDDWFASGKTLDELGNHITTKLPDAPRVHAVPELMTRRMSEVESREIDWLWPNWLPKGMLTLLGGYAGDGKSTIALALAAELSNANALPDGSTCATPVNTLLVLGEDDVETAVKSRLNVHKADHDRIHTLDRVKNPDGTTRGFNIRSDVPLLRSLIERERIGLIIIDPLSSFLANGDRNNEGEVRDTLSPLVQMLEETKVALIGIMHIGKTDGHAKAMQKLMGSTAFTAVARSVWMISDMPPEFQKEDEPTRKMIGVAKSNYAMKPAPLQFYRPLDSPLSWLGISPVGIEEVYTWKSRNRGDDDRASASSLDVAEEWLLEFMDGKPVAATEIEAAARDNGISVFSLRRVKKKLGMGSIRTNGIWMWNPPRDETGIAS